MRHLRKAGAWLVLAMLSVGCRQDMHDQPRYEPLEESRFFEDGRSSRPLVEGVVPRGFLREDPVRYTGRTEEGLARDLPFPWTREILERGRERYDIFCSPCHDRAGTGQGMVVLRGFRRPPSFHEERLRSAPLGHFFDVVTNGFGVMPSYRSEIPVDDRWAIAAYIRVLQRSQHASLDDVPPQRRRELAR
ncbi:MAG: hypothetical protein KatS3mg076_0822 [Candidatus Binatia bacterium]|nr:MAG: hypothetical protein KatS3mg076_0822 [Candidatus Binatia bacterium]